MGPRHSLGQGASRECHRDTHSAISCDLNHFVTIASSGISTAFPHPMKGPLAIGVMLGLALLPLQCATLEQLSMTDLIAKSTAIVRAKVMSSYAAMSGPVIYTHYQLQVSARYKGAAQ